MTRNKITYIVGTIVLCVLTFFLIVTQIDSKNGVENVNGNEQFSDYSSKKIFSENIYEEEIEIPYESVFRTDFMFKTISKKYTDKRLSVTFTNQKTGEILIQEELDLNSIVNDGWTSVSIDESIRINRAEKYVLTIAAPDVEEDEAVMVGVDLSDDTEQISILMYSHTQALSSVAPALVLVIVIAVLLFMNYKRRYDKDFVVLSNLKYYDWGVWGIWFIFCSLFFCLDFDLKLTAMQSYDLIDATCQGKFFKFYTYVMDKAMANQYIKGGMVDGANYNIINYIILAIPIIPVYILDKIFIFDDLTSICLVVSIVYVMIGVCYSAYLLYTIGRKIGFGKEKSRILAYVYLSSPMLIMATTEIGQIDIFEVILILISLQYYLDKKYMRFSVIMSFAIGTKALALFAFVPLILYAEKDLLKIIKYTVVGLSFSLITRCMFLFDNGYAETKAYMNDHYNFLGKILGISFPSGNSSASYFLVAMAFILVLSYIRKPENGKSYIAAVVYIPLIVYSAFMCFVAWHPQWISLLVPFISMSLMIYEDGKVIYYLEMILSVSFVCITNLVFTNNVDVYMVNGGILPLIFNHKYTGPGTYEIINALGIINVGELNTIFGSAMTACLFLICILIAYGYKNKKVVISDNVMIEREMILCRMSILLILNLFYITIYFTK